jgi:hypothetical protein
MDRQSSRIWAEIGGADGIGWSHADLSDCDQAVKAGRSSPNLGGHGLWSTAKPKPSLTAQIIEEIQDEEIKRCNSGRALSGAVAAGTARPSPIERHKNGGCVFPDQQRDETRSGV